jgi:TPR repeat protein
MFTLKEIQQGRVLGKMLGAVPRDDDEAAEWFLSGEGNATAQMVLGDAYRLGEGVSKDLTEAVNWYRRAAEQGNEWSQYMLGQAYSHGYGVQKDDSTASEWYFKAAKQGNAKAQFYIGVAYSSGIGVPKDEGESEKWYRRSAEQGEAMAQVALGLSYYVGTKYIPKKLAYAYMWMSLAAAQGTQVKARDDLLKKMNDEEIAEGQRLFQEWLRQHQDK